MTAANRTIVLSMGVVLLGASSLLASPRRVPECYLLEKTGEGSCPSSPRDHCINVGSGCPTEPDRANCTPHAGGYTIHCCFNGNDQGVCAPQ